MGDVTAPDLLFHRSPSLDNMGQATRLVTGVVHFVLINLIHQEYVPYGVRLTYSSCLLQN